MRRIASLAVALVVILPVVLFTASCTDKVVQTQPVSTPEPEVQKAPDNSAEEAEPDERRMERIWQEVVASEAAEPEFVNENIHFGFDSYELSSQAQQILSGMADYLRTNPDLTVIVEGHCDERGTDEYNLALGQQRAESAKVFLVNLGVGAERLKTFSYGENRPIAVGHNEASWARNRRAKFVIN